MYTVGDSTSGIPSDISITRDAIDEEINLENECSIFLSPTIMLDLNCAKSPHALYCTQSHEC